MKNVWIRIEQHNISYLKECNNNYKRKIKKYLKFHHKIQNYIIIYIQLLYKMDLKKIK